MIPKAKSPQDLTAARPAAPGGSVREDPADVPPVRSPDPGDDYLIALAASTQSVIVSGDAHLSGLGDALPVHSAVSFLSLIEET